jgi:phosphatidylglycerol:prolipoprotein diacylglycerol transferase
MVRMIRAPAPMGAHFVFEALAYAVGFWIYRRDRARFGDVLAEPHRNYVIVAAILGAAAGSKLLGVTEKWGSWAAILGGKTIVGGLLGGTVAVEWMKHWLGIRKRTGDLFAVAITVGMAIGRVGCFLGGMSDRTYGTPTALPWGVDFGDGVTRHPVQFYEVLFLLALAGILRFLGGKLRGGEVYRVFLVSYLAWRLAVDFLKPEPAFGGLSGIQWACVAGLIWYVALRRDFAHGRPGTTVSVL